MHLPTLCMFLFTLQLSSIFTMLSCSWPYPHNLSPQPTFSVQIPMFHLSNLLFQFLIPVWMNASSSQDSISAKKGWLTFEYKRIILKRIWDNFEDSQKCGGRIRGWLEFPKSKRKLILYLPTSWWVSLNNQ